MKKINDSYVCSKTGTKLFVTDPVEVAAGDNKYGRIAEYVNFNAAKNTVYVRYAFDRKSTPLDVREFKLFYIGM